jgi:hypothetical protein
MRAPSGINGRHPDCASRVVTRIVDGYRVEAAGCRLTILVNRVADHAVRPLARHALTGAVPMTVGIIRSM